MFVGAECGTLLKCPSEFKRITMCVSPPSPHPVAFHGLRCKLECVYIPTCLLGYKIDVSATIYVHKFCIEFKSFRQQLRANKSI